MLTFHKIRWKNFLSTGAAFTEIELDKEPITLIIGKNGAGKSTVIDALSFALFDSPFRNIQKDQIINTRNKKNCLVEVEFSLGADEFIVRRGRKPNVFEIVRNGKPEPKDGSARDQQKAFEKTLGFNKKSFHQIVVLGSSSFVSFMNLTTPERRDIIEDILDLKIFTKMNELVKLKIKELKAEVVDISRKKDFILKDVDRQNNLITTLEKSVDQDIKRLDADMEEVKKEGKDKSADVKALKEKRAGIDDKKYEEQGDLSGDIREAEKSISVNKYKINDFNKTINFFKDNTTCPTCDQEISEAYAKKIADEAAEGKAACEKENEEKSTSLKEMEKAKAEKDKFLNEIRTLDREIEYGMTTLKGLIDRVKRLQSKKEEFIAESDKSSEIEKAKAELKDIQANLEALEKEHDNLRDLERNYNAAARLLKDDGVKSRIIETYVPTINDKVNEYLDALDLFVKFELDSNFNETIKSRHLDGFSYSCFSEGEKKRIDIALLLTWREIARMKNSIKTNLLIIDEIFDGSLDAQGVSDLTHILSKKEGFDNIFLISHKSDVPEKIAHIITFVKRATGFSEIQI